MKDKDNEFLKNYFKQLQDLIGNDKYFGDLVKVKEILLKTHQNKKKQCGISTFIPNNHRNH